MKPQNDLPIDESPSPEALQGSSAAAGAYDPRKLHPSDPYALSPNVLSTTRDDLSTDPDQPSDHGPILPPGTGKFGMWLLLSALFMLFAGSLVAYTFIRLAGSLSPERGAVALPHILWASTLAIVASSFTIHVALHQIKHNQLNGFKILMLATLVLASVFVSCQIPGLWDLLASHETGLKNNVHIYGLVFILVLLHALHILGGVIPMFVVTIRAWCKAYSAKDHNGVTYLVMYWHFLDIVWIVMFLLFLSLG